MLTRMAALATVIALLFASAGLTARQTPPPTLAIVGGTVIDGNGGAPLPDATVIVTAGKITTIGSHGSVTVPPGATVIDATGKFVTPGLIDTNVHLSLYGGVADRYETLAKYHPRQREIVLEAAQIAAEVRRDDGA